MGAADCRPHGVCLISAENSSLTNAVYFDRLELSLIEKEERI